MATKYHPGTLCCKCFLCGSKHKYYDHYATFSDEEKQFIVKNLEGSHPPESSCICKADHVEASKHCSEDNYIPKQSLSEIIASMKEKLSNTQDHLASCIQQAAIYVAQSLLSDRALLLPDVSRMFLCSYGFELDDDTVTNASYELKGLHEHLSYKCIHKKFGTILYNKRGDLLKSLSWALGSKGSAESSVSAFSLNSPDTTIAMTAPSNLHVADATSDLLLHYSKPPLLFVFQIWKDEANIKSMTELIENFQLLPSSLESNRGLFNPFSKVHATAEQSHDLDDDPNLVRRDTESDTDYESTDNEDTS